MSLLDSLIDKTNSVPNNGEYIYQNRRKTSCL